MVRFVAVSIIDQNMAAQVECNFDASKCIYRREVFRTLAEAVADVVAHDFYDEGHVEEERPVKMEPGVRVWREVVRHRVSCGEVYDSESF